MKTIPPAKARLSAFTQALADLGWTDGRNVRVDLRSGGADDQIIQSEPAATTAAGAVLALDHVLQSDDLFLDRSESPDLQMLWLLVKAARDYIASVDMCDWESFSKAG
jgi:hypothetical protein